MQGEQLPDHGNIHFTRQPSGRRPATRTFPFSDEANLHDLAAAWKFSAKLIERLAEVLCRQPMSDSVACVAISGSLARMEAHDDSDLDLLVVIDDRNNSIDETEKIRAFQMIWEAISTEPMTSDFRRPKRGGIFAEPVSWRNLVDEKRRGVVDEDVTTYGQRMQLLIDSQPVIGTSRFVDLQKNLLTWYAEQRVRDLFFESGPFHWMWQDVQRYWRSIRARASWLHANKPRKSLEVNLKLRSSRLVIVAAFLLAVKRSTRSEAGLSGDIERLLGELEMTPLERLVNSAAIESNVPLQSYQTLWNRIRTLDAVTTTIGDPDRQAMRSLMEWICRNLPSNDPDWLF